MRKLVVSMNLTLDGFMCGPDDELDWHFQAWSGQMGQMLAEELGKADTILLGRITYCAMAAYWPKPANALSLSRDDLAFADMMNSYSKVVFSKTLKKTNWNNSRLIKGRITQSVREMKTSAGKNIIIYGSGQLVGELARENLVDQFVFWLHPVVIGKGKSFFTLFNKQLNLCLIEQRAFQSGVVLLRFANAMNNGYIPAKKSTYSPSTCFQAESKNIFYGNE
jgi:dihydrofolate reductase